MNVEARHSSLYQHLEHDRQEWNFILNEKCPLFTKISILSMWISNDALNKLNRENVKIHQQRAAYGRK
jgi:hypothetical protein